MKKITLYNDGEREKLVAKSGNKHCFTLTSSNYYQPDVAVAEALRWAGFLVETVELNP